MKSLSQWKNRRTTLQVGRETYTGVVSRYAHQLPHYLQQFKNTTWQYVFKTDNGEEINISSRRVIVKGDGLVLRLDNGQKIKTLQSTR